MGCWSLVAVRTQALVGAVGVHTLLTAGHTGQTLVYVHTALSIVLQVEPGPTLALHTQTHTHTHQHSHFYPPDPHSAHTHTHTHTQAHTPVPSRPKLPYINSAWHSP